jgi:hypothetical protein
MEVEVHSINVTERGMLCALGLVELPTSPRERAVATAR